MTSKLWVYGDSFANSEHNLEEGRSQSWPYRLSTHFDEFESHARWGIGNDYNIERFLENNPYTKGRNARDIGIFYFSHPRRLRLPIHEGIDWVQSHSYTNENNKRRGDIRETLEKLQRRLKKNGWLRQVQEQVMHDEWRWRNQIELQINTLNTYAKYFDMLILHTGFYDVAEIATKSPVLNNEELKSSSGFVWLDVMPLNTHPKLYQPMSADTKVHWIQADLRKAPCHLSPQLNKEFYKIMLAACTTHNIKPYLKNGWTNWSDCTFKKLEFRQEQ